jgi:hypothetical protein
MKPACGLLWAKDNNISLQIEITFCLFVVYFMTLSISRLYRVEQRSYFANISLLSPRILASCTQLHGEL